MRWLLLLSLLAGLGVCKPEPQPPPPPIPRSATSDKDKEAIAPEAATGWRIVAGVRGERQVVVAAHPEAARAGQRVLREGGNALDASIAMAIMLTLVEPQSSGIGGGALLLHWDGRKLRAYDGRETAPAAATGDMFLDKRGKPREFTDAVVGGLSVGVPGEIAVLELAHRAHGKLPWAKLFAPAIELAEKGFPISERLHSLLGLARDLPKIEPAASYFYTRDKQPKPVGTILKNPELAATLRAIAEGGAKAFYEGDIGQAIVKTVKSARNPGRLALPDLKGYRPVEREPLCMRYRRFRACAMPPPTSGGLAALQIFGMLERFDLPAKDPRAPEVVHLFAEASKLAYAD
ncbi:MAG TPA: gamma-glutamyltransferase, partial [Polyangiaceae bacterium]|nr:gamma-glutamyltransferase [Polyangiaceae bacterium]